MSKTLNGVVSALSGNKTIAVKVERRKTHPTLHKQFLDTTKFMVHDEASEAQVGDKVTIVECRPLSATKHFQLERILVRAKLKEEALAVLKADNQVVESSIAEVPVKPSVTRKMSAVTKKKSVKS